MEYHLKLAKNTHSGTVYLIRNNRYIRRNLIDNRNIPFHIHKKNYVKEYVNNQNWNIYLIMNEKDIPVGYCDTKINAKKKRVEIGFKILPKYQGAGAGTYAMGALLAMCKEKYDGYDVILTVLGHNHRAIEMYEKFGFITVHVKQIIRGRGKRVYPLNVMKLGDQNNTNP